MGYLDNMYMDYKEPRMQQFFRKKYEQNELRGIEQTLIVHECKQCGKTFYSYNNNNPKYCSYRCANEVYITKRKEIKALEKQKECEICGKPYTAKKKDSRYCSNACKQKAYRMKKIVTDFGYDQLVKK